MQIIIERIEELKKEIDNELKKKKKEGRNIALIKIRRKSIQIMKRWLSS